MDLVGLLLELKPLMADPEANFKRITALLEQHQSLAEYEVARFYVSRQWLEPVGRMLRSVDPRERHDGVKQIPLLFAGATASASCAAGEGPGQGRVEAARAAVHKLGLADVSPPDCRFKLPRNPTPQAQAGGTRRAGTSAMPHAAARQSPRRRRR